MPRNIPINQHLYVICDNPYVIHMLHTPLFHFVTAVQKVGELSTWVLKKIQYVMFFVVHIV